MQYDNDDNALNLPHHVASVSGTHEWASYENYFAISAETIKIVVSAQLNQCTGSLWDKNIHLYPVNQTQAYRYFKIFILTTWGVYFLYLLCPFFLNNKNNHIIRIILILVFILIILIVFS